MYTGFAELDIDIDLGKYRINVHDMEKNKNWTTDPKLIHADAILGRIEECLLSPKQQQKMDR